MTKQEAWEQTKPENATCDFALPQTWLDSASCKLAEITQGTVNACYQRLLGQVVWMYRKDGNVFGEPFGITDDGKEILELLK
jgi:hypothetical protein